MRKSKKESQNTDNSGVYKSSMKEINMLCHFCRPNKGCNRKRHIQKNWKQYRKTQW